MTLEIGSSSSPRPLSLASRRAHLKVESHPSYTSRPCSPMTPNPPLRRRTAGPPATSPRWWGRVWCRPSWWLRIVLGLCRLGRTGCQRVARVWLPRQRSLLRRRLWQCWRKWRWSEDRSRGECASWCGSRTESVEEPVAWGGFAGFNLLEMGFSEFDIFLFGLVVLYFWIDLAIWGFRIWWFCWIWKNGDFEIFNFWILISEFVFLFKTHLDLNSCDFWFIILFKIFFI